MTQLLRFAAPPSEVEALRALMEIQAVALTALLRRVAAVEADANDLRGLMQTLLKGSHCAAFDADAKAQTVAAALGAAALASPLSRPSLTSLALATEVQTGVTVAELRGPNRGRHHASARKIFCAMARRAGWSTVVIGKWVNRDASSVHAAAAREAEALDYFRIYRECVAGVDGAALPDGGAA